jgi:hypothetical protein
LSIKAGANDSSSAWQKPRLILPPLLLQKTPRAEGIYTIELYKEKPWSQLPGFRYLQVQLSFLFKTKFIKNYDTIIYSGDSLIALLRTRGTKIKNIAYMHTPPRHLYDNYEVRLKSYSLWKKMLFIPFVWFNRWRFETLSNILIHCH